LNADGFHDGPAEEAAAGMDAPGYTLTARLRDGSERVVRMGGTNDRGQRFLVRGDEATVYLLGDWNLNHLRKRAEVFLDAGGEPEGP